MTRQPQVRQTSVESSNLEKPDNPPIITMADNRTMAQLLEAPTEGYEDAIVIPEITANNFEIKHGLLNLVQNKQFFGNDKEDLHDSHPRGSPDMARKRPPRSIETWDDLVSKFINKFFPPSKTTNLRNEITRFQQKFDETFYEAWDHLALPELTPTCMSLELADRSITEPISIAKDVRLMVGKFQFPTDFVVVDFEPDPRVPLILGRCFLKTSHALIDVYEGEITLRVGKEAITFNLDQTSRYTANYNHMTANRIDVIELACEEYSQEFLGFSDSVAYGNPSPDYDFGDSDFLLLEEANAFIAINDEPISRE
ncbi:reverse transcriptase domain-containing protein, partial [Tanacetum coccineum]